MRRDAADDVALAVDRLAERVDDAAEHASPTGTERMRPVAFTVWPSSMRVGLAEHDGADRVLVEVQREADGAVLELEQLVDGAVGQARDAGDAVTDLGDAPDGAGLQRGLEALEVLLERRCDVGG